MPDLESNPFSEEYTPKSKTDLPVVEEAIHSPTVDDTSSTASTTSVGIEYKPSETAITTSPSSTIPSSASKEQKPYGIGKPIRVIIRAKTTNG